MKKLEKLQKDLLSLCMYYSKHKSNKARETFGKNLYNKLIAKYNLEKLNENQIIHKGAQWGGKWGNFYHAIYFRKGKFHFGAGFTQKQILA